MPHGKPEKDLRKYLPKVLTQLRKSNEVLFSVDAAHLRNVPVPGLERYKEDIQNLREMNKAFFAKLMKMTQSCLPELKDKKVLSQFLVHLFEKIQLVNEILYDQTFLIEHEITFQQTEELNTIAQLIHLKCPQ